VNRRNTMVGVRELIAAWSDPIHVANVNPGRMSLGKQGQININGEPKAAAHAFSRNNPRFIESLEPGIRSAVVALINRLDCITYTSCEGHLEDGGASITDLRHIGILPRNGGEFEFLRWELEEIIKYSHDGWLGKARISLVLGELHTELGSMPCIDLVIEPADLSGSSYFTEADQLTNRIVEWLNAR
jgi:hypothetical protein